MVDLADITALPWPLRTERLAIRPATHDDLEPMWRIRRQPEVGRWMGSAAQDLDAFAEFLGAPERLAKTLVILRDDRIVGDLMLAPEDPWAQSEVAEQAKGVQAELGWCLDPALQGGGYATEAVRELIRVCFEDLGFRRLVAHAFADNEPSWRLMERVGMRREAYTVKDSLHRDGQWRDGLSYALLAEEWAATPAVGTTL